MIRMAEGNHDLRFAGSFQCAMHFRDDAIRIRHMFQQCQARNAVERFRGERQARRIRDEVDAGNCRDIHIHESRQTEAGAADP